MNILKIYLKPYFSLKKGWSDSSLPNYLTETTKKGEEDYWLKNKLASRQVKKTRGRYRQTWCRRRLPRFIQRVWEKVSTTWLGDRWRGEWERINYSSRLNDLTKTQQCLKVLCCSEYTRSRVLISFYSCQKLSLINLWLWDLNTFNLNSHSDSIGDIRLGSLIINLSIILKNNLTSTKCLTN